MSSYVVLARKYRPKQFADMVGQQSVVRTLVNAIQLNRTHQGYVFSGSRGIGKTSIARIFSKALRCENASLRDGLLYSCDQCADCIEIAAGTSVNVIEIDGASNNSVDNVREIRESAKFLPSSGKYKIYIVDEVHMLSTPAFNALLKTLEEPPEHVVFIFATTEAHKIPDTILGRCQRFDFKRVTVPQIIGRIREVLKSEKIEAEDAALSLVARAAEGSMRDALSILDQVISFSGSMITAESVRESIGLIGTEMVSELLQAVLSRNAKSGLGIIQTAFHQGVDLKVLLKALIEMVHALILIQAGVEKPETHFTEDELRRIRDMHPLRPLEENELIFQVYHHGLDLLSRAAQPKLIFDLLIVKTALAEVLIPVNAGRESVNPRRDLRPPKVEELAPPSVSAPKPVSEPKGLGFKFGVEAAPPPEVPAPVSVKACTWDQFIELSFATRPVLAILLESVVEWEFPKGPSDRFRLGFREKDGAKVDQLQTKPLREQFALLTEAALGFKVQPDPFFSKVQGESLAEKNIRLRQEVKDQKVRTILSNPIVQEARSLFGADLTEIKVVEPQSAGVTT